MLSSFATFFCLPKAYNGLLQNLLSTHISLLSCPSRGGLEYLRVQRDDEKGKPGARQYNLRHLVPGGYKYGDLALQVGGVSNETVKYGPGFCGESAVLFPKVRGTLLSSLSHAVVYVFTQFAECSSTDCR
jgi:hypothetical protein